jgi:hypothetical protein
VRANRIDLRSGDFQSFRLTQLKMVRGGHTAGDPAPAIFSGNEHCL